MRLQQLEISHRKTLKMGKKASSIELTKTLFLDTTRGLAVPQTSAALTITANTTQNIFLE